jgi:hypothetical protein
VRVPDFRATIRSTQVRLVDWGPHLARSGPLQTLLHARGRAGVGIADLTIVRDDELADELIAEFLAGDARAHRESLRRWAAAVGYRRAWFPGEVVELEPRAGGAATTTCTGCRARLTDSDPRFWLSVRRTGRFPAICPLCGCDLPQWSTMSDRAVSERLNERGRRGEAEAVRRAP